MVRGIPRFFQTKDYYWGEISREKAAALLAEARKTSWERAVCTQVENRNLQDYYRDLQRTAWLAVLGLDSAAVALDIGSGYGAITHSLALSLGEVYSIEAVPERIEFTQERLRQEGIQNVSLLQASATGLPFFENSFDVIVVNGVLEWIGEWDQEGSPRSAQLKFLSTASRLLKEDGVLLLGIENRFGGHALRGQLDHSGRPYTSIVPRWLATQMLRRGDGSGQYAFLKPNSNRQYRTYTYSSRGYRKLLKEAGFKETSVHWADPGYNRPHHLVPLDRRHPAFESYRATQQRHDEEKGLTWKGNTKIILRRLFPLFANEFVIVAGKRKERQMKADLWLKAAVAQATNHEGRGVREDAKLLCAVHTRPFSNKCVLQLWSPEAGQPSVIAKVSFRNETPARDHVAIEFKTLERVTELLSRRPELGVTVPQPLGLFRNGNATYTLESCSQGTQFLRLVNRKRYAGSLQTLRADFARLIGASINLTQALQSLEGVAPIDTAWYRLPAEVANDASLAEKVNRVRYFSESGCGGKDSWIQHGDFVIDNLFLQENNGSIEVIDWAGLAAGYPPLYDIFTLIIQPRLAAYVRKEPLGLDWEERTMVSFAEIFLEESEMGGLFRDLLLDACEQLGLHPGSIPALLTEFLLIRTNFSRARHDVSQAAVRMLRAYVDRL